MQAAMRSMASALVACVALACASGGQDAGAGATGGSASGTTATGTGGTGTATGGMPAAGTGAGTPAATGGVGASGAGAAGMMPTGGTAATGCDPVTCAAPFQCCGETCANLQNDIKNCGACGTVCPGATPYCDKGTCGTPPCLGGTMCPGTLCCGLRCCTAGQICCEIPGPIETLPTCVTPNDSGTCPTGCTTCKCNAPETPIATPDGARPIASLREGDLVYSVDGAAIVAVPVVAVLRNPVDHHHVVRITLDDGEPLEISAEHPLADGRSIGDLRAGAWVDGVQVRAVETVSYAHAFTYDILPASRTGAYYAGGMLLRSTLSR